MKLACIAYLHGFGGAERQLIALANQMVNRGHEVNMLLVSDDKIKYPLSEKIIVHSLLDAECGNKFTKIFNRRSTIVKKLLELKCDIVVNFNFQSAYLLSGLKNTDIGKIVYSERGDPGDREYRGVLGMIRKFILHKIDGFVFQSNGARNFFKDSYVHRHSTVIPNACFYEKSLPVDIRSKRVVTVGRLSHQKNQRVLIDAFSRISHKYSDFILEIYGEGPLKCELESLVKDLGIRNQVFFRGTTSDLPSKIKDAALFVLSSDYEGIPNALIEAMSLGLPCISTDCKPGGARMLISEGINGLITPLKNVDALANAMDFMLSHSEEAEKMAMKATEITDRLSPKNIYDKWEDYLISLCLKK